MKQLQYVSNLKSPFCSLLTMWTEMSSAEVTGFLESLREKKNVTEVGYEK